MDELTGFERKLAAALGDLAGPIRPVDALAVTDHVRTARPSPAGWRIGRSARPLRLALLLGLLVALALAAAALVASRPSPMPASISNGWIAFAASPITAGFHGEGEFRDIYLTSEGATGRRIIGSPGDGFTQGCPRFSPDGSRLAYGEGDESVGEIDMKGRNPITNRAVVVVAMGVDGEPSPPELRFSLPTDRGPLPCPEWSPTGGNLAFFTGSELRVVDLVSGATTTLPVGVESSDVPGWASLDFEWAPDGKAIRVGRVSIPIDGSPRTWLPHAGTYVADGQRIFYVVNDEGGDALFSIDVATGADRLLDTDVTGDVIASPDGTRLAYQRYPSGVVVIDADGSNEIVLPDLGEGLLWSPDGQRLLSRGWDFPTDGVVADLITIAVMPGSVPVVTSFSDLAFEHMSLAHVSWQAVLK